MLLFIEKSDRGGILIMSKQAVVINQADYVATAVANLAAGSTVSFFLGENVETLILNETIRSA
jgi:hypothetical protein